MLVTLTRHQIFQLNTRKKTVFFQFSYYYYYLKLFLNVNIDNQKYVVCVCVIIIAAFIYFLVSSSLLICNFINL